MGGLFFFLEISDKFWCTNDEEKQLFRRGVLAGWLAANFDAGLSVQQSKSLSRYEQLRRWLSMEDRLSTGGVPLLTYTQYKEWWSLIGTSGAMGHSKETLHDRLNKKEENSVPERPGQRRWRVGY